MPPASCPIPPVFPPHAGPPAPPTPPTGTPPASTPSSPSAALMHQGCGVTLLCATYCDKLYCKGLCGKISCFAEHHPGATRQLSSVIIVRKVAANYSTYLLEVVTFVTTLLSVRDSRNSSHHRVNFLVHS